MRTGSLPQRLLLGFALLLSVALATPARAQETIAPADAALHMGKKVTVCGFVASTGYIEHTAAKPTFLNFDKPYPDHTFTVVIFPSLRNAFDTPPEVLFNEKRVCVTGTVARYRGAPQIVLREAGDIHIVR